MGRVLADRFHHAVKRTPTEVRRAVAYVLLKARERYGVQMAGYFECLGQLDHFRGNGA